MTPAEPIPLNGIKVSPELLLIRLLEGGRGVQAGFELVRLFSGQRINLPFVSLDGGNDGATSLLTVEMTQADEVTRLIRRHAPPPPAPELIPHAVLVSLYPNATRLELLGRLLHLVGREAVPVYGMASSIGALAFLTAHDQIDRTLSLLEGVFALPANRSPCRAEFTVEQSTITRPPGGGSSGGGR